MIAPLQKMGDGLYKPEQRPIRETEWALKTTKYSVSPEKVPKFQQYKDYNFPSNSIEDKMICKNRTNNTDPFLDVLPDIPKKKAGLKFLDMKSNALNHTECNLNNNLTYYS